MLREALRRSGPGGRHMDWRSLRTVWAVALGTWAAFACGLLAGCSRQFRSPQSGRPLAASANPATVAPRALSFIEVVGGSGTYSADLRPADEHSGGDARLDTNPIHPGDGGSSTYFEYRAGSIGGVSDKVTVSDSAGNTVSVSIAVGEALTITPAQLTRAPLDRWTFQVVGGLAPYAYSIESSGSSGCDGTLDGVAQGGDGGLGCVPVDGGQGSCVDGSGTYVARSCGGGLDRLVVTDQTGTTTSALITVSSELQVEPATVHTGPGGLVQFFPSGGVPPYAFSVADHGNRSGYQVDGNGHYTAGPNANVEDLVRVTDAVGATRLAKVSVDSASLDLPRLGGNLIQVGDFNADTVFDVVAVTASQLSSYADLTLALGSGTGFSGVRHFSLPFQPDQVLAGDFDGDGTDDLLLVRGQGAPRGVMLLTGRRDGSFDFHPEVSFAQGQFSGPLFAFDGRHNVSTSSVYAMGLAPGADGGGLSLLALGADRSGAVSLVGQYDLPVNGTPDNAQLLAAPFPGYDTTLVMAGVSQVPGCSGFDATVLAWSLADDGGLLRDPSSDKGPLCVPAPTPPYDLLSTFYFDPSSSVPDFIVEHNDGWNTGLTIDRVDSSGTQFTTVAVPGALRDTAPSFAAVYFGSWAEGLEPELVLFGDTQSPRYVFDSSGALQARPDPLPGPLDDLTALDFDGDTKRDALVVENHSLRFLRGTLSSHLATGHSRVGEGYSQLLQPLDLDGDGFDDLLSQRDPYTDGLRVYWGGPNGQVSYGPVLAAGRYVDAVSPAYHGAWLLDVVDGQSGGLVERYAYGDGGTTVCAAPLDYDRPAIMQPIHLGLPVPDSDAGAIEALISMGTGLSTEPPPAGHSVLALFVDGGVQVADDPALQGPVVAPVSFSGGAGDDLVVGYNDTFLAQSSLQLYRAAPSANGFWADSAADSFTGQDSELNPMVFSGAFSFASHPGGPRDRVLVVLAPMDPSSGLCTDTTADTFAAAERLAVYDVSGGLFSTISSQEWYADFTLPLLNPCAAQLGWHVSPVYLADGSVQLLIDDNHAVFDDSVGAQYLTLLRFGPSLLELSNLPATVWALDATAADLDGDHLSDVVVSSGSNPELLLLSGHADGGLY